MATKSGDVEKFKHAIEQQNSVERAPGGPAKHKRDAAEAEAAHHGLGALEKHSKGRPKQDAASQKATTKKSPQSARSQSR
ncbi:hypothetical protein [Dongia sedimenti]|uniref:DUF5302 domain-containing protein n=1 Tax=Dongia sedimenti TaxID=3064282 RepID=A0ABU0YHE0_9PROT|nr:hypothetical protein [Rhodospirillaceae bacterium R-7]